MVVAHDDNFKIRNRLDYIVWQNDQQVGMIKAFSSNSAIPAGWLECNGQEVPINSFRELYRVLFFNGIGTPTIWGTSVNPDTHFRLPDLRGVFLRGVDDGRGIDSDVGLRTSPVVDYQGVGSYQADEFKSHDHSVNDPGHSHTRTGWFNAGRGGNERQVASKDSISADGPSYGTDTNQTGITTQLRGGAETRPKNVAVRWIIKVY